MKEGRLCPSEVVLMGSQKLDPNRSNNKDFDGGVPASDGFAAPQNCQGLLTVTCHTRPAIISPAIIYFVYRRRQLKDEVDDTSSRLSRSI